MPLVAGVLQPAYDGGRGSDKFGQLGLGQAGLRAKDPDLPCNLIIGPTLGKRFELLGIALIKCLVRGICGSLMRSNGGRKLGSRGGERRIARTQLFVFVASWLWKPLSLPAKRCGAIPG